MATSWRSGRERWRCPRQSPTATGRQSVRDGRAPALRKPDATEHRQSSLKRSGGSSLAPQNLRAGAWVDEHWIIYAPWPAGPQPRDGLLALHNIVISSPIGACWWGPQPTETACGAHNITSGGTSGRLRVSTGRLAVSGGFDRIAIAWAGLF